jgi:hypothetical protein
MITRLIAIGGMSASLAVAGCGSSGGGGKVSSASLKPRLLPASSVRGFGLQRTLDWSNPVNLAVEGFVLPQALHPSAAVQELETNHLKGAAGEILVSGGGQEETEVRVGVAKFDSAADANRVADWMHHEDRQQPCFSQCIFAPYAATLPGVPNARYVIQGSHPPPLPPGAPRSFKGRVRAPANYLTEFTIGPYLYWANLRADSTAKARFEQGMKLYYQHAKQIA